MIPVKLPEHIAIIMDGNGRWAEKRSLPRFQGHVEGVKRVEEIAEAANTMGIKALTLFTFSSENWGRPKSEVSMIMKTICNVLEKRVSKLEKVNIKLNFVGKRDGVPEEVLKSIDTALDITKNNTGLLLNLAFNYGSRIEIVDAVKSIAKDVQEGKLAADDIDEKLISDSLYTKGIPDPDLLIRTSGEQRISNFLLWQLSYAEFYFTDKCWPEFDIQEFKKALSDYQKRERRYGKVDAA